MIELDASFAALLGRQPSDKERQNLYRVRDALGLKNNDALWLIIMALQHYENLYARVPKIIKDLSIESLKNFEKSADATAKQASNAIKLELVAAATTAIKEAGREVAATVARKEKLKWLCATVVLTALTFGGFGWLMHRMGLDSGYLAGYGVAYTEAKDEKIADAWANTAEGQLAYRFAQSGELQRLARCRGEGWVIEKGNCYPHAAKDGTYGWTLPR